MDENYDALDVEDLELLEQLYPELASISTAKKKKKKLQTASRECSKSIRRLHFSDEEDEPIAASPDVIVLSENDSPAPPQITVKEKKKKTKSVKTYSLEEAEEKNDSDESMRSIDEADDAEDLRFSDEDEDEEENEYDENDSFIDNDECSFHRGDRSYRARSPAMTSPPTRRVLPTRSNRGTVTTGRSLPAPKICPGMITPSRAHDPPIVIDDSDNDDNEESFQRYLQKLKNENKREIVSSDEEDEILHEDSFVVSDDEDVIDDDYERNGEDSDESCEDEGSDRDLSSASEEETHRTPVRKPLSEKKNVFQDLGDSFNSPSVSYKPRKERDPSNHFLASLNADFDGTRHSDAVVFMKRGVKGEKTRDGLVRKLFAMFNREIFEDKLPENMSITFNARLRLTAGYCKYSKRSDLTTIEISPKVCTTPDRIRDTLAHEMCHAAVFVIDKRLKERHGPVWQRWAKRFTKKYPCFPVISRCHAYEIEAKYVYECEGCGQKIKRHSKSLDTTKKCCGICRGKLVLQGENKEKKAMTPFAAFVQLNYGEEKTTGKSHKEIMQSLSAKFKLSKETPKTLQKVSLDLSIMSIHEDE